jgi:hypothetical protein
MDVNLTRLASDLGQAPKVRLYNTFLGGLHHRRPPPLSVEWRDSNSRPGVPLVSKAEVKVTSFEKPKLLSAKLWGLKVIFKVRIAELASIQIQVPPTWIQI